MKLILMVIDLGNESIEIKYFWNGIDNNQM